MSKTLQGKFRPKNPEKYKGDVTQIYYRSSWERMFMNWADNNDKIKRWQSEEKAIWYDNPITKRKARYFPDFIVEYERRDGITVQEMVEIKPARQVAGPPTNPKRRTQAWMRSVMTYATNKAKWNAAMEWAEDRGMSFRLLTENDVPGWKMGSK